MNARWSSSCSRPGVALPGVLTLRLWLDGRRRLLAVAGPWVEVRVGSASAR